MSRALVLPLLLVWALLPTFSRPVRAEPPPQQPASDSKDLCSYLKDVEAKADEDCGADNLAALKSQDPAAYVRLETTLATRASPLLNAQQAQIDIRKFTEYALNPNNPVGMHKARVFKSALGYTRENCQSLIDQVKSGILSNPAIMGKIDNQGTRYTVDILVRGPAGQAVVRTGWIYLPGSEAPRLVTALIK